MDEAIVAAFAAALREPDAMVTDVTTLAERGRDQGLRRVSAEDDGRSGGNVDVPGGE